MVEKMTAVWLIILTIMVCAAVPAILIWLTMYVFIAPVGVLLAVHEGLKWRELRHIDTERLP